MSRTDIAKPMPWLRFLFGLQAIEYEPTTLGGDDTRQAAEQFALDLVRRVRAISSTATASYSALAALALQSQLSSALRGCLANPPSSEYTEGMPAHHALPLNTRPSSARTREGPARMDKATAPVQANSSLTHSGYSRP